MRCTKTRQIVLLVGVLLFSSWALAKPGAHPPFEVTGNMVSNHDGDTLKIATSEYGVFRFRLSGADTPESGQAYWRTARDHLRQLVAGKQVRALCYKRDRYDREVCHAWVGMQDIGEVLIADGYAWYARRFAGELSTEQQNAYEVAEQRAKANGLGLWVEPDPMPPWQCRQLQRQRQACR